MVAIFTGAGTGFERGSGASLGAAGLLGSATHGRGGEQIFLNAANGNLLINRRDEFLVGRGQDAEVARTYNSLGDFSDDNGDNWRQSTDRRLFDQVGLNTLGASIKRQAGDGSIVTYVYDGTAYVATDGAGAHDSITWDGSVWRRTDGDSRIVETYGYWQSNGVYLTGEHDKSGIGLSYSYSGNKLAQITTSNGEAIYYYWSGNNITDVVTGYVNAGGAWANLTRTRYAYDHLNRLLSVAVDLTPEDNSTSDGNRYVTQYRYHGDSKLIAGISQSDGSDVSFGYDRWNRVAAISELVSPGVYRTTTINYHSGFTLITDANGQVTRLDYSREDEALPLGQWGLGHVRLDETLIAGEVASRYEVTPGGWPGVYQGFYANAGDTLTWSFTLQADGPSNVHSFGLYNNNLGWGGDFAVARVVSGPGVLTQLHGGIWQIAELSWSQPTRIEITRHYSQASHGGAYFYVDTHYQARPGHSVRMSDPSLSRSNSAVMPSSTDIGSWGLSNVTRQAAGTISETPAYRFDNIAGGNWSATAVGWWQGEPGAVFSATMSLRSTGYGDGHGLVLYGDYTGYGENRSSTARIISGPGRIVQYQGGLWRIEGLSTTEDTRVEVTRSFDRLENVAIYLHPDWWSGYRQGAGVIAGATAVYKRFASNMSGGQLTAITRPAANGQPAQVTRFEYDRDGNLSAVIDPRGAASRFTYDARGNALTSTDRLGNVVTRTYNAANQLLTETRTASDASGEAVLQTTRYVYDGNNQLRFVISPEGRVSEYWYDGPNLVWTFEYTGQLYNVAALGTGDAPNWDQLYSWRTNLGDLRQISQTWFGYDARGNQTQRVAYGAGHGAGGAQVHRGYTHQYFTFDQAGQKLRDVIAGQNEEQFRYDGLGRLVSALDVNGGTTTYSYNDGALQTVIRLASGQTTTTVYNRAGDVLSTTESGWYSWDGAANYAYDGAGRLRIVTDPRGNRTYYVYDERGRRTGEVNASGALTEYQYDENDRQIGVIKYHLYFHGGGFPGWIWDALNTPTSGLTIGHLRGAASAADIAQWSIYDAEGRVIQSIAGDGAVTNYAYDGAGRLIRTTQMAARLSEGQIAAFKANAPRTAQWVPDTGSDRLTRTFYDRDGNVIGTLNAEGGFTRTIYDGAGRKIQDIAYEQPVTDWWLKTAGTLNHLVGALGNGGQRITRYVYDGQDNLRFTIDALGQVTEFGYQFDHSPWTAFGPVRTTRVYANRLWTLGSYDLETVIGAVASIASGADRISYNIYDGASRLVYSIDAGGQVTGYVYDAADRVTREIQYADTYFPGALPVNGQWDMDNWSAQVIGNPANRVKRYYYAGRGELRFEIDAEGYVTRHDYDAAENRVFSARWSGQVNAADWWNLDTVAANQYGYWVGDWFEYNAAGLLSATFDREGQRTEYVYNATGTLAWEIRAPGSGDEARVAFGYDAQGRLIERTEGWGTAEARLIGYTYDAFGNQVQVRDGEVRWTNRDYDKVGRVVREWNAAGSTYFAYDTLGNLVRTIDARGNASYNYFDVLGRVTVTRDAEDYVTETTYTAFGEIASVTRRYNRAWNGAAIGVLPAFDGSHLDATTSFGYDNLGRVKWTRDAEGYIEYKDYNAFGNVTRVQNKLGGVVAYFYDRRGQVKSEFVYDYVFRGDGNIQYGFDRVSYSYDLRGNVVRKVEGDVFGEGRGTNYVYDLAGRLIEERGDATAHTLSQGDFASIYHSTPTTRYRYDLRGNLIEKTDPLGGRTVYYYNDLDQKIAEVNPVGSLTTFAYDRAGNLVASRAYGTPIGSPAAGGTPPAPPGGEVRETLYAYDGVNRLISQSVTGVYTAQSIGGWVYHGVRTVTTSYEYDARGNVVKTTDGAGGETYAYYDRANRKIAQVDPEGYLTRWTLDGEGNVVSERRYAVQTSGASVGSQPYIYDHYHDRITNFGYDRNGRRTYEQRLNVAAYSVSGAGLYDVSGAATIYYGYNGLGQVVRKVEATGEAIDYQYDSIGRLRQEIRAGYVDQNGAWVRPTVRYDYNALGDLAFTRQGAQDIADGDRVTRYFYNQGRLTWMTNAQGQGTYFYYDEAGNLLRRSYERENGSGAVALEGVLYGRDVAGRVTSQGTAVWNGSWWHRFDTEYLTYNGFGEMATRRMNGGDAWGRAQEYFDYDTMGQLWRSNSGDGVWRYHIHDGAGRRTVTIESEGADIAWVSLQHAIGVATQWGAFGIGAGYVDGVNVTINRYDRRGLAIETILPYRELSTTSGVTTFTTGRTYNAFGEVIHDRDTRGLVTDYHYTTTGRVRAIFRPDVVVTNEAGVSYWTRPADYLYYDISGRLVATDDANGRRTTRNLLAGTGYGESEALVTAEYRPDGSQLTVAYDRFGDARVTTDGGRTTWRDYDALGRLSAQWGAHGVIDFYAHDILGQRIRQWNIHIGGVARTDYDAQGRVTREETAAGIVTNISYAWYSHFLTAGMGYFGGWEKITTSADWKANIEQTDRFGRTIATRDQAGRWFSFEFDLGGRTTRRSGQGRSIVYHNLNTGRLGSITETVGDPDAVMNTVGGRWTRDRTSYGYDAAGNLTSEAYTRETGEWVDRGYYEDYYYGYDYGWGYGNGGRTWVPFWQYEERAETLRNGSASYDALNRMTSWSEAWGTHTPAASINWSYDAVGNVRRVQSSYWMLNDHGGAWYQTGNDHWYRYDAMNRVVVARGAQYGGWIGRGSGTEFAYNADGQRAYMITNAGVDYYGYDAEGRLTSVSSSTGASATYQRDALGRVTVQNDLIHGELVNQRQSFYGTNGVPYYERTVQRVGNTTSNTDTWHYYDAVGNLMRSDSDVYNNAWQLQYRSTTTNSYAYFTGAVQTQVSYAQTNQPTRYSYYTYNSDGVLTGVSINDGRPRTVNFDVDQSGQIIRRREQDNNWSQGDPYELYYRFGGKQLGYIGNNGTLEVDYRRSIELRTTSPGTGAFRGGASSGTAYADFDQSGIAPITSYEQGAEGGGYVVRSGDTLQGIAQQLWGDASLWYKLAQANGLSAGATLAAGQRLTLPSGVQRATFNAATLNPYDPASIIGDTSPTTPTPQARRNRCGIFGAILLAVVAVVVAIKLGPAAIKLFTGLGKFGSAVAGGALAGAAGSVASQSVGLITGLQNKFNWGAVGLAALGGAIGGGLQEIGSIAKGLGKVGSFLGKSDFVSGAVRGALSSSLTQGIAVATGLQTKFDWAGVAGAALGGGIGAELKGAFAPGGLNFGERLVANSAGGIANAAARSLIEGTSFGDNLIAALPDVISGTVGDVIAEDMARRARLRMAAEGVDYANGDALGTLSGDRARFKAFRDGQRQLADALREGDFNAEQLAQAQRAALAPFLNEQGKRELEGVLERDLAVPREFGDPVELAQLDTRYQRVVSDAVTVIGTRIGSIRYPGEPALGLRAIDQLALQAGAFAVKTGEALGPAGHLALTVLGYTLDALGGPVVFAARQGLNLAVGAATDVAAKGFAKRFHNVGYSAGAAALGGIGAVVLVGLAVGAGQLAKSLRSLAKLASSLPDVIKSWRRPAAETIGDLKPLGPDWRVLAPGGKGAATGALPKGYRTVSRWVSPDEAAAWMGARGTGMATISGTNRMYVTELGAAKPGGTGPIRVDFALPEGALQRAGKSEWFQIFQPTPSRPIYNVQIHVPKGIKIPGY